MTVVRHSSLMQIRVQNVRTANICNRSCFEEIRWSLCQLMVDARALFNFLYFDWQKQLSLAVVRDGWGLVLNRCWQSCEAQTQLFPGSFRPGPSDYWRSLCHARCPEGLLCVGPSTFAEQQHWFPFSPYTTETRPDSSWQVGRRWFRLTLFSWAFAGTFTPNRFADSTIRAKLAKHWNIWRKIITLDESRKDQRWTHFHCSAQCKVCRIWVALKSLRNLPPKRPAKTAGVCTTDSAFLAHTCLCFEAMARRHAERSMATSSAISQLRRPLCK